MLQEELRVKIKKFLRKFRMDIKNILVLEKKRQ